MLYQNYQDIKKIDELINLGDISVLDINVNPDPNSEHSFDFDKRQDGVVVAYKRDRGENNVEFRKDMNIKEFKKKLKDSWEEYAYLFDGNKWLIADIPFEEGKDIIFEDLKDTLEELNLIESDIKI